MRESFCFINVYVIPNLCLAFITADAEFSSVVNELHCEKWSSHNAIFTGSGLRAPSMKVSARVRGEWLAIPCMDATKNIAWLGQEALRRYVKLQPATYTGKEEKVRVFPFRPYA